MPGRSRQPGGHMNDQDSASCVPILFNGNLMSKSLEKAGLCSSRFGEGVCAHDRTRTCVCHAKNNFSSSFIGEGNAVLHQFVEMEAA